MVGQDYLKLQNQGNIISNIRLLHEMDMAKDYADSQGYYTKKSVAEIGVNALIITSGNSVGEEAHRIINAEGDESRNSPLQNAKARMQILRVLGLVSADYGSEVYAITRLGKLVISQVLNNNPNYGILRELFVNITTATEIYEHNCAIDFNCYLGFGICYALSQLEYRLSSNEMPLLTTYDIKDIDQFIEEARLNRQEGKTFTETHLHYPKTQRNQPIKQVSNLTRSINQILRVCGIIEPKQKRIGNVNYYVCTEDGRKYVDPHVRAPRGLPARIRTAGLQSRSLTCYPAALQAEKLFCDIGVARAVVTVARGGEAGGQLLFVPAQIFAHVLRRAIVVAQLCVGEREQHVCVRRHLHGAPPLTYGVGEIIITPHAAFCNHFRGVIFFIWQGRARPLPERWI